MSDEDNIILPFERNRRERSTVPLPAKEVIHSLTLLSDRVDRAEGTVKSYRRLIFATLGLSVLALVSAGSVLIASHSSITASEMKTLLEENLKKPIEHLEQIVDRLDQKF